MPSRKEKITASINIIIIIFLFVFFSYIIQTNIELFRELIDSKTGIIIYILIIILSIVFAPVSAMPLMPIASNLWGISIAAILSIIGWTIGAWIAFLLARKCGIPLIKKLISVNHINKLETIVPKENLFLTVVFLRMTLPVDALSYALGLFSQMKTRTYLLATIIGITPFAFIFAALGVLNIYFQILGLAIAFFVLLFGFLIQNYRKKKLIK